LRHELPLARLQEPDIRSPIKALPLGGLCGPGHPNLGSETGVWNWFAANNGPNGETLVVLKRHSEEVLETVLQLAGRQDLVTARKFAGAREKLRQML
jgi:hypothetical protein